ncbi:MAG TPA: BON domain-containing protein [Burkholderiaceae bacterium]|nr:BON domain-containing protein [Burkholderiaceae bacterium]
MTNKISPLRLATLCAALALTQGLSGCAPLVVGGAMAATTMMATDRRSAGTQIDDQSNELKAAGAIQSVLGDRGHVNATSFNRVVLLTGEVPTAADKQAVAKAVTGIETVRYLVDEVAVMPNSSMGTRTNDTIITGKVKAAFVDGKTAFNSIKVVTERGVVYLMGLVTEPEASRAVEIARGIGGVVKVVRVFQIITQAELDAIEFKASTPGAAASAPAATTPAPAASAPSTAPAAAPPAAAPAGATTTPVK